MASTDTSDFNIYQDQNYQTHFATPGSEVSFISSDSGSEKDYESQLFNDENLLSPTTISTPALAYHGNGSSTDRLRKSPDIIQRPSMRMTSIEQNQITRLKSKYNKHSPTNSSKLSITSLSDITNVSLDRRNSKTSSHSMLNKRYYSITDNGSVLSAEQKRTKIIQKLSKRNSKNISTPYFYQYTQNNQPRQLPPVLPDEPLSPTNMDFTFDDSFNFINKKIINNNILSTFIDEEPKDENGIPMKETNSEYNNNSSSISHSNTNSNANENNNNSSTDNNNGSDNGGGNGNSNSENQGNSNRNNGGNSGNSSRRSSKYVNNTSNNYTSSSGDNTTESDERNLSAKIQLAQRQSYGFFNESSVLSNSDKKKILTKRYSSNTSLHKDNRTSKSSENTVDTENLQLNRIDPDSSFNNGSLLNMSLPSSHNSSAILTSPILTVKNINSTNNTDANTNNSSNETRLKDFNLVMNNHSTMSVLPQRHTDTQTGALNIPVLLGSSVSGSDSSDNTSATNTYFNNTSQYLDDTIHPNGNKHDQESYRPPQSVGGGNFNAYSDGSQRSLPSNGSRDKLLPEIEKRFNIIKSGDFKRSTFLGDSEKDYTYYSPATYKVCNNSIAWILLTCSLLAPPFFLLIAIGYLDKVFGVIDRKLKILSAVAFGVFLLGSIVGIAVGFGYGLTHAT